MISAAKAREMLRVSNQALEDRTRAWRDSILPEIESDILAAIKLNINSINKSFVLKMTADGVNDSPVLYVEKLVQLLEICEYKVSYHHERGGGFMFNISF